MICIRRTTVLIGDQACFTNIYDLLKRIDDTL